MCPYDILDVCVIHRNGQEIPEVLVQWDSLLPEDTSWEPIDELQSAYP